MTAQLFPAFHLFDDGRPESDTYSTLRALATAVPVFVYMVTEMLLPTHI